MASSITQIWKRIDPGLGTARAENAEGTPTQSHTSPSILVYEEEEVEDESIEGREEQKAHNLLSLNPAP